MTITPDRLAELDTLTLDAGAHFDRPRPGDRSGMCLLEAVAYIAGEPHTDTPLCVSPHLRALGIAVNDFLDQKDRQRLVQFIPAMIGTTNDGLDEARQLLAVDWTVRVCLPTRFDAIGLGDAAAQLRALPTITREQTRDVCDILWAIKDETGEGPGGRFHMPLLERYVYTLRRWIAPYPDLTRYAAKLALADMLGAPKLVDEVIALFASVIRPDVIR